MSALRNDLWRELLNDYLGTNYDADYAEMLRFHAATLHKEGDKGKLSYVYERYIILNALKNQ